MESSTILLSLIWGIFLTAWATIFTFFPSSKYSIINFVKRSKSRYIFGAAALILGMFHVQYHNIWEYDLSSVITLFGWVSIIKGLFLILDPHAIHNAQVTSESPFFKYFILIMYLLGILLLATWLSFH